MKNSNDKLILILSNSQDATCDYFEKFIYTAKARCARLNTDFSPGELSVFFSSTSNVVITINGDKIKKDDIKCVWNRRPEKIYAGNNGESAFDDHYRDEWRHSIDAFFKQIDAKLWVNYPPHNAAALSKIEQIVRASRFGMITPKTLLTQNVQDVLQFANECTGSVIVKPVSHGYICKGDQVHNIYTCNLDVNTCNFENLVNCPTLFQEKIAKLFDVRINYIDGMFESVKLLYSEDGNQRLDIRRNNMDGVKYEPVEIPCGVAKKLSKLINSYKLRFAAVDMCLSVDGRWIFFEINPNGQWAWLDMLGATNFSDKLLHCMLNP